MTLPARASHFCRAPLLALLATLALGGCERADNAAPPVAAPRSAPTPAEQIRALAASQGVDGSIVNRQVRVTPETDPLTRLGRELFFSRTLSADRDVACASCHHPLLAGGDGLSLAIGVAPAQPWHLGGGRTVDIARDEDPLRDCDAASLYCGPNVSRNSPTVFNVFLYDQVMLWDGRVEHIGVTAGGAPQIRTPESAPLADLSGGPDLLAAQALLPVAAGNEMRGFAHADLVAPGSLRAFVTQRLDGIEDGTNDFVTSNEAANWRGLFQAAFPALAPAEPITFDLVQLALSAYQRSLFFVDTRWNRFLAGNETLNVDELAGARLFFSAPVDGGLGCSSCHSSDHFTDQGFHNVGFPQIGRGKRADRSDRGRGDITREASDNFAFRTSALLNVALTAPYGHAGTFQDLDAVLRYHANPSMDGFLAAWDGLAQFDGMSLDTAYPRARILTTATLAAGNLATSKLPMRDLTDDEVAQLTAFLGTLTDSCVTSAACLADWIPDSAAMPAGDDADGNLLVMGQQSPIDIAPPPPGPVPDPGSVPVPVPEPVPVPTPGQVPGSHALVYESQPPRSEFQESESCSPSSVTNAGTQTFVESADQLLVPNFQHGYAAADWFISGGLELVSIQMVMVAGGVTAAYLDNDCWPDLLFTGGTLGGIRFYRNANGSQFDNVPGLLDGISTPAIGNYATGITYADLNGDYRREFVLGNLQGAASAENLHYADQDHVIVLGQRDDGTLYRAGGIPFRRNTYGISFGDPDADGDLDMYTAHWGAGQSSGGGVFWENYGNAFVDGQAEFELSQSDGLSQQFNFTPSFADLNGDGWQDLVVASDFNTSQVLQNVFTNGHRAFQHKLVGAGIITDQNGMGGVLGDYDNDGDLDWFVASIYDDSGIEHPSVGTTGNRLYQNTSTRSAVNFRDATDESGVRDGSWGWGACMEDMDNDGWLDIFMENGFGHIPTEYSSVAPGGAWVDIYAYEFNYFLFASPRLFISNGRDSGNTVSFTDHAVDWGIGYASNGRGVACFDYDRDGDIDIVSLEHSGSPRLLVNQVGHGAGHGYLDVQLVGRPPNTDAVGARVVVSADLDNSGTIGSEETQTRVAQANSTYTGRGLPNLHFGLRSAATVARLEVWWPGSPVPRVCTGVQLNQHVVIDQRRAGCP